MVTLITTDREERTVQKRRMQIQVLLL